jgi:glycosyltransferase involved in cell wall biosynthesis
VLESCIDVIYDVSALGAGVWRDQGRTGIFRVVQNVARELVRSPGCNLTFCASASFRHLRAAQLYLESDVELRNIPFIYPRWNTIQSIASGLDDRLSAIGTSYDIPLHLKAWRRTLLYSLRFFERTFHRFDPRSLPETGIFHSSFYSLPRRSKIAKKLQRFLTIYDLVPVLAPQFFGNMRHFLHDILASIQPDDWVLCISEATKNDFCDYLKFDPARVFVSPLAASPDIFYPCSSPNAIKSTLARYNIPDAPYVLSLNTLEPRKNIDHTIRCFMRLVREQHLDNLNFVLVGPTGWDYGKILDTIREDPLLKNRIILTGYVPDEDLAPLYSGSLAFAYMSLYEGFGLPPLEAMQCGVPVITSNTSSLPEVVSSAGIMLDPQDEDGLCNAMLRLYENASLREEMSNTSLQQAQKFSWRRCGEETLAAYKSALSS